MSEESDNEDGSKTRHSPKWRSDSECVYGYSGLLGLTPIILIWSTKINTVIHGRIIIRSFTDCRFDGKNDSYPVIPVFHIPVRRVSMVYA